VSLLHPQTLRPHRSEIRRNPVAVPAAPASPERENPVLVELAGFLGHRYRTLSICTSAGLLLGLAYAATAVPAYRATATIEVQDLNENFLRDPIPAPMAWARFDCHGCTSSFGRRDRPKT